MRFLFALLFIAAPLFAQQELCRFRAGERENPFQRWLVSQDVVCSAMNAPLPPGKWNVFAHTGNAVSLPALVEDGAAPTLTLVPSATLSLTQSSGLVYLPRRAVAYPAQRKMLVPAGEPLWLLTLEKSGAIASIVPIAAIEANTERAVDARSGALPPSILGWLQLRDADRAAIAKAVDVALPRVHAGAKESDPLPPLDALDGALVLVRGATADDVQLDLGGRGWLPHRIAVKVGAHAITVADQPLLVRPAASLLVSFSTPEDLTSLDETLGECVETRSDAAPQFVVAVSSCPEPSKEEPLDPKTCREIRVETFLAQIPYGSFAIDDIPPGFYRAELRFGKLPPISNTVPIGPLEQTPLRLFGEYEALRGSLTRGGEPLERDASIAFPGGGIGFAPKENSEYAAVLLQRIEVDDRIAIASCDGRVRCYVISDQDSRWNARFDLDIPGNELTVRVTDTFTTMLLHNATLRLEVMPKRSRGIPLFTQTLLSHEQRDGAFVLKGLPEREIHVTVSHPGYQKYIVQPFTMAKSEQRTIEAQLVPLRSSSRGRIVSARPFESATITWMSAAGLETEHAELAPDGSFDAMNTHEAGETMAIASLSHPLWVARSPAMPRGHELTLQFPDALPMRTFASRIADRSRGATYVGIVIGGLLVPQGALRAHQTLRAQRSMVSGGQAILFRELVESGPIEVILGPTVNDVPSRGRAFDPLLSPQAADAPRQKLLPGMNEIVFP
jgi:hypothetical protein